MNDFLQNSVYLGLVLTFATYGIGMTLKKRFKTALINPLLISIVLSILFLIVFDIDYEIYYDGAKYISYLLTPATICLAIPLYEQFELLKQNYAAIFAGILSGILTSLCCILGLSILFHFNHKEYVSLLPKSITTAIGMDVSAELGGYVSITAAVIIITGILGNVFAELLFKLFCIKEPIGKGVALGTSAHALGTAKALEIGEIEGAMSSLSIVVSGIITVAGASIFAQFL